MLQEQMRPYFTSMYYSAIIITDCNSIIINLLLPYNFNFIFMIFLFIFQERSHLNVSTTDVREDSLTHQTERSIRMYTPATNRTTVKS